MMEGTPTKHKAGGFDSSAKADATANEPSETSSRPALRFNVNQVNLDPNQEEEEDKNDDYSPRMNFPDSQMSVDDATTTIGYATHDAVPMTVFYRNENSQSNSTKKSRPTLKELRKGFEEDHEQQV